MVVVNKTACKSQWYCVRLNTISLALLRYKKKQLGGFYVSEISSRVTEDTGKRI